MANGKEAKYRYKLVAVGGTFDVLHSGHAKLLGRAFSLGESVLIGMTSDEFARSLRKSHPVASYRSRRAILAQFLESKGWSNRARIVKINDPFGPSTIRKNLEALVVSPDTRLNAVKINRIRWSNRMKPVAIHVVPLLRTRDGKPISSTRIRQGELGREARIVRR